MVISRETKCNMKMKQLNSIVTLVALVALPGLLQAQPTSHYCPGSEGLLGASVPPPGWYVRDYNVFYSSDRVNNSAGESAGPPNFNVFTYAQVPRVIWVTPAKLLGANVGVNALMPILYEDIRAGALDTSGLSAGDLFVDSFLAWHPKRFDFVAAAGFWAPTGNYGSPTDAGLGYWTCMLTFGGTWYITPDKAWAISLLNRYENNSEQRDTHITHGNAYTLEWGISRKIWKGIEVGPAGYVQTKVTKDSGPNASPDRDSVASVGPEIGGMIPKIEVLASVRYLYEFMAMNRAQGQTVTLTLTKRF